MKKGIFTILTLGVVASSWCFAEQAQTSTIFEIQDLIEKTITLEEKKITEKIPFTIIKSVLERECDPITIKETKEIIDQLNAVWLSNIPTWKVWVEMKGRFNLIKKFILSIATPDEKLFCKQKYLTYTMLETSQKLFKGEPLNSLFVPQEKVPLLPETRLAPKNEVLEQDNVHPSASSYPTFLTLHHHTQSLSNQRAKELPELTERYIQTTIGSLLKNGILNEDDLKILDGNIELNYTQSCEKTRGTFHILKNKTDTIKKFKGIKLSMNLCQSESFYANFEKYVQQILTHELGHYLYFFKDSSADDFDRICRNEKENHCQGDDFVSSYALTNKEEDYAESFAYRYLESFNGQEKEFWSAPENEQRGKKELHFNTLVQKLK